jgi:hypothetical protein
MNRPRVRQVLDCASPLALWPIPAPSESGRGLPQSKTLSREPQIRPDSWSQCARKSERRLPMKQHLAGRTFLSAGSGDFPVARRFLLLLVWLNLALSLAVAQTPQLSGELKQWHKITLTLAGPSARESDTNPNPFTDYRMTVTFTHESGSPSYLDWAALVTK